MVTIQSIRQGQTKIALVGLGYVGLPLAAAFGRKTEVIGFDISETKISELRKGIDRTGELSRQDLEETRIAYTTDPSLLRQAQFIIVTVPTPIDDHNNPDLTPVRT